MSAAFNNLSPVEEGGQSTCISNEDVTKSDIGKQECNKVVNNWQTNPDDGTLYELKNTSSDFFNSTLCTYLSSSWDHLFNDFENSFDKWSIMESWRTFHFGNNEDSEWESISTESDRDEIDVTVTNSFLGVKNVPAMESARIEEVGDFSTIATQSNTLYADTPDDQFGDPLKLLIEGLESGQISWADALNYYGPLLLSYSNTWSGFDVTQEQLMEQLYLDTLDYVEFGFNFERFYYDYQIPPEWLRNLNVFMGGKMSKEDKEKKKKEKEARKESKRKEKESKKLAKLTKISGKKSKKISDNASILSRSASKSSIGRKSKSESKALSDVSASESVENASELSSDRKKTRKKSTKKSKKKSKDKSVDDASSASSGTSYVSGSEEGSVGSDSSGYKLTEKGDKSTTSADPSSTGGQKSPEVKVSLVEEDDRARVFGSAESSYGSSAGLSSAGSMQVRKGSAAKPSKESSKKDRKRSKGKSTKGKDSSKGGSKEKDSKDKKGSDDDSKSDGESGSKDQKESEDKNDSKDRSAKDSKGRSTKDSKDRSTKKDSRLLEAVIEDNGAEGGTPRGLSTTVEGEINFDKSEASGESDSRAASRSKSREEGKFSLSPDERSRTESSAPRTTGSRSFVSSGVSTRKSSHDSFVSSVSRDGGSRDGSSKPTSEESSHKSYVSSVSSGRDYGSREGSRVSGSHGGDYRSGDRPPTITEEGPGDEKRSKRSSSEEEEPMETYKTDDYEISCPCKRHFTERVFEFTCEDAGLPTYPTIPQIVLVDALSSRLPVDKPENHPEMHLAPRRYECVCPGPCMCPKPAFVPSKTRILSLSDCCKICVVCGQDVPVRSSFTAVFCAECNGNLCTNCTTNHHFNLHKHFIHDIYGNAIVFCKIHPPDDMSKGPLVQKRHCQKCHSILHKCRMSLQCNRRAIPKIQKFRRDYYPKRGECYHNNKKCCKADTRMETCTCSKACAGKTGVDPTAMCKVHGDVPAKQQTQYSFSECYVLCVVCGTEVSKSPFSCVFCEQCKGNICSVCVAFHYGFLNHSLLNHVGKRIHLCSFHSRQMPRKSWQSYRDPAIPDYNCIVCHAMSLASAAPITRTQFEPLKRFMRTKSARIRSRRTALARRQLNEELMGPLPSRRGRKGVSKVTWNNRGATLRLLSARGIVSKEIPATDIVAAAEKIGISKDKLVRLIAKNKIKICAKEKCSEHLRHPHFERVAWNKSRSMDASSKDAASYTSRIRKLKKASLVGRNKSSKPLLSPNWLSKMMNESKHKKVYNTYRGRDAESLDIVEAEKRLNAVEDRFDTRATNEYPFEWKKDPIKNTFRPNPRLHTNYANEWWRSMPFEEERFYWRQRGLI